MSESFQKNDAGSWIEVTGFVKKLLSDDNEGSRHQRFVLDIGSRRSLLIAHNIDLAKRVPVGMGDRVHWTHHDPHGVEEGGYVRYRTKSYL